MIDRDAIFRGEIIRRAAFAESRALAELAVRHVEAAFACERGVLPSVHERHDGDALWSRTCAARAAIATDPEAKRASIGLATALGFDRGRLAFDVPRLRIVAPGAHARAAAARAYYMHRDTWYGSPASQLNVWIPLFDVTAEDSFSIFPDAFGVAVDNDSGRFDCARFVDGGGFQSADVIDAAYPRALEAPPGPRFRVSACAGDVIVFSAAHLHGTTPNETRATRLSIDVRFVDLDDLDQRGVGGAPDADNASRGSALVDYLRGDA